MFARSRPLKYLNFTKFVFLIAKLRKNGFSLENVCVFCLIVIYSFHFYKYKISRPKLKDGENRGSDTGNTKV